LQVCRIPLNQSIFEQIRERESRQSPTKSCPAAVKNHQRRFRHPRPNSSFRPSGRNVRVRWSISRRISPTRCRKPSRGRTPTHPAVPDSLRRTCKASPPRPSATLQHRNEGRNSLRSGSANQWVVRSPFVTGKPLQQLKIRSSACSGTTIAAFRRPRPLSRRRSTAVCKLRTDRDTKTSSRPRAVEFDDDDLAEDAELDCEPNRGEVDV
jgi:hypothetical protein